MDADNDPSNGCEKKIQENVCHFGTCHDFALTSGKECGNWEGRLFCEGNEFWSCCVRNRFIFDEGTTSFTTTTFAYSTVISGYN